MRQTLAIVALACLLGACTAADNGDTPVSVVPVSAATTGSDGDTATLQHFASSQYGFAIDYPATMQASRTFATSYLDNGTWKTYAGPGSQGTAVFALMLPDSNKVTAGELRIGVSDAATEVAQCTTPPDSARPDSSGEANVGGTQFTHFDAGDAAMSHYLDVHSYRTVHAGRCYAIDLLIIGTNPEVYDPPATPPFTHDEAFARLYKALQGFRFTTPAQ